MLTIHIVVEIPLRLLTNTSELNKPIEFFCAVHEMPAKKNHRAREEPDDEIQPADPEPSPGSVIARIGGLSVGSRQSSGASTKSSKSSKSKISSRSASGGKIFRLFN